MFNLEYLVTAFRPLWQGTINIGMDNKYFKYVNLPFSMEFKQMNFGIKNHVEYPREYMAEFETWLNTLGLRIGYSEVFRKRPDYNVVDTIHIDGHTVDDHVKINWVVNPGTSTMSWWQLKPGLEHTVTYTALNTPYLSATEPNCDLLVREHLVTQPNRPALVNAGQLHGIENLNTERICYSFMLMYKDTYKKVPWDEAVKIFKDYF